MPGKCRTVLAADGPSRLGLYGSSPRRQGSSLRFDLTASGFGLDCDSSSHWEQLRDVPANLPDIGPIHVRGSYVRHLFGSEHSSDDLADATRCGGVRPSFRSHDRAGSPQRKATTCTSRRASVAAFSSPLDRQLACSSATSRRIDRRGRTGRDCDRDTQVYPIRQSIAPLT